MDGLNPNVMVGYLENVDFIGGEIKIDDVSIGFFQDFEKNEILERVTNFKLSDDVGYFTDGYEHTFNIRKKFLWNWLGVVYGETGVILSSVDNSYYKSITDLKIILTMAFSILDDISEVEKDENLLKKILNIIRNRTTQIDFKDDKLLFFIDIWNYLLTTLKHYPRYEEFKDIFWFDFEQMLNSVKYNVLVNKYPEMINLQDMHNYDCHNMIVFLLNGIDLMVSPSFSIKDLPQIRNAFWHAQQMARIGNWLSTWKRELNERDFCSGVFAYAFENDIIKSNEIGYLTNEDIIDRIENSGMQKYFMNVWKNNYIKLSSLKNSIQSVDIDLYLNGLQNLIKLHLASEGLK
jgi:hypothetical protein